MPTPNHIPFKNLAPHTPSEHYWASRALKAEALLSAREKHYEEVSRVREQEESKRNKEVESLEKGFKQKYDSLEKLVIILISAIVLLVAFLIYLTTSHTRQTIDLFNGITTNSFLHSFSNRSKQKNPAKSTSWLSLNFQFPSHFTIPILSPWTSVVEHQSSTSTSSSSFLKYFTIISLFISIPILILIVLNIRKQHTALSPNAKPSQTTPYNHLGGLSWILESLSDLGLPQSFTFWRWALAWSYRMLRLIGLAPG